MTRVIAHMVAKDEAGRYLRDSLAWLSTFVDDIHVYDDRSADDTADVAASSGAIVKTRPVDSPSFMEHEGLFRQAAWLDMEEQLRPSPDDLVVSVDADEFMVSSGVDERTALDYLATIDEWQVCRVNVVEVYDGYGDILYARTDGYWGSISGCRIARWRPGGIFQNRRMGCGSLPYRSTAEDEIYDAGLAILHMGYVRQEDRLEKHARYSSVPGHNPRHVASILSRPVLERWDGRVPVLP
jgi:hypothetical protein